MQKILFHVNLKDLVYFHCVLHSNHYGAQVERGKNSILSKFKDLVLLPACNISFINFSQFQFAIRTLLVLGAERNLTVSTLHFCLLTLVLEVIKIELR